MTKCCGKQENASLTAVACFSAIAGTVAWHLRIQSKKVEKKEKVKEAKKEAVELMRLMGRWF